MSLELLSLEFAGRFASVMNLGALTDLLSECCALLGFSYFAITQHPHAVSMRSFRFHNYPVAWEREYDQGKLVICDPVHRVSQGRTRGFRWHDVPDLIATTPRDRAMLDRARDFGIEDGYTIPTNVPGEMRGSVTFATRNGQGFPVDRLLFAHALGSHAFDAGRRLSGVRSMSHPAVLTDRQVQCVLLLAQGKSNAEIARTLGIKVDTVKKHLQDACARYRIAKRVELPVRAIYENALCFDDVFA